MYDFEEVVLKVKMCRFDLRMSAPGSRISTINVPVVKNIDEKILTLTLKFVNDLILRLTYFGLVTATYSHWLSTFAGG